MVKIKIDNKGKYGRSIGGIYSNGFDVGKEMIRTGVTCQKVCVFEEIKSPSISYFSFLLSFLIPPFFIFF